MPMGRGGKITAAAGTVVICAAFAISLVLLHGSTPEISSALGSASSYSSVSYSFPALPDSTQDTPPPVITLRRGRQLFVDDYLIDQTTLTRTFHQATYHPANPVILPDQPWEQRGYTPTAMVYSDGVWYDPADHLFKMWYMCGFMTSTCYATSTDGIQWVKPSLNAVETGTNLVSYDCRDSGTVWLDLAAHDPARRYKMFLSKGSLVLFVSADGIHWSKPVASSPPVADRSTVYYDPFQRAWVYSLRYYTGKEDVRLYRKHPDPVEGLSWKPSDLVPWTQADALDSYVTASGSKVPQTELYNLDATPYESLMVGLFTVFQGDLQKEGYQKHNQIFIGFSRDGFHWERQDHHPFIVEQQEKGAWNWGNIQSAGGGFLVVGDQLYFYVSGREQSRTAGRNSTGLATLRRDGFASMDAGDQEGILTTRPLLFGGGSLFVNAAVSQGTLRVEVLDENGNVLEGYSRAHCMPLHTDSTMTEVQWNNSSDLSFLSGKPVRFRFVLQNGSLYSFWISSDMSGQSGGYVAGGGPGVSNPTDDDPVGDLWLFLQQIARYIIFPY